MQIDNKTRVIISCSSKPSNFGAFLYNYLFKKNNLNILYIPVKSSSSKSIVNTIKGLNVIGASISMPFKKKIINHLDKIIGDAKATKSVNTVLNKDMLIGYNTDVYGFQKTIKNESLNSVAIYGTGSVVNSIINVLKKREIKKIDIYGRNHSKVKKIIKLNNIESITNDTLNYDLFINATPVTINREIKKLIIKSKSVFDIKVSLKTTSIEDIALKKNKKIIRGIEMYKYQFIKQFYLYTKVKINKKYIDKLIIKLNK